MNARKRKRWPWMLVLIAVLAGVHASAQDIVLPRMVPSFNQAYNEGPGAWGECPLGTNDCPDQICVTGCLVTAFASVLAYYDISLFVDADDSCTGEARSGMDPGIFNDWLRASGGYGHCAQDPMGNCCLVWGQLPRELDITTHVNRSDVGLNPVAAVVIDHALRQGDLVVAGVHWGTFCGGGSTQTEDCHWVILTGKRDETYTIIDPYNPDPANPRGVRTTLDAGVRGAYIIDRYVIVTAPSQGEPRLEVRVTPENQTYEAGQAIQISMTTPGRSSAYVPFARVTDPSGSVGYATIDPTSSALLQFSAQRASLSTIPRSLGTEWVWFQDTLSENDVGRWSWEVWIEDSDAPGTKLDQQAFAYNVKSMRGETPSAVTAIIGILLVVTIAGVAFLTALGSN